jgi:hypothetical protein
MPQIWRGELAQVEILLQLLDFEQEKARQATRQLEQLGTPQIWRGELAQVDTLYSCWMLSMRRRAKLPNSWSSFASNMARRIGSGRHPLQLLDVEQEEVRQAA